MSPFVIGIVAGALTATAMLPQLIKIIKTRQAHDISLLMLGVLITGLSLWVYYGILQEDWVLILTNATSVFLGLLTGFFSIKYRNNRS